MVYLIEQAWIDPLENRDAHGYESKGYVDSIEEAEKIVNEGGYYTSDDCWSIQFLKDRKLNKFKFTPLIKL